MLGPGEYCLENVPVGFGSVPGGAGAVDYAWLTLLRCLLLLLLLQHWGDLGGCCDGAVPIFGGGEHVRRVCQQGNIGSGAHGAWCWESPAVKVFIVM